MIRLGSRYAAAFTLLAVVACAAPIERPALEQELALPPPDHGPLQRYGDAAEAQLGPGESAHWLLDTNRVAYVARLALTDQAVSTLDVQYFIWQEDSTGTLLALRLIEAADRGVKVRLLLDDFDVARSASQIVLLDAHPRIEVRIFNPWAHRSSFGKVLEFLLRWNTLTHRMHNKTYIADNRFAIVGGRNIGDRYFGVHPPFVQNDLDVMVAGPLTQSVTASFDLYWNAPLTYRVGDLERRELTVESLRGVKAALEASLSTWEPILAAFQSGQWESYLDGLLETLAPGVGELYLDLPGVREHLPRQLYDRFLALVGSAERELLISSPYFIPDRAFIELLQRLVERGVRVALITNSLASNNHTVAHTGYRHWRRATLAAGVELYEMRSDAAILSDYVTQPATAGFLGLHTKAVVVDRRVAFIGSPNVDPRSMILNTEIAVVTESEVLAERLVALISRDMQPENAWRVTMDEAGWLRWSSGDTTLRRQPAKNFRQRVMEFFLNLLPLRKQV
jgi:putative cardiolipin synthase